MKKNVLIVIGLLIFSVGVYYFLGGFKTVEVQVQNEPSSFVIYGKEYIGKFRPSDFRKEMEQVTQIQESVGDGILTAVFVENDTLEENQMHYIVGLSEIEEVEALKNYKKYSYQAAKKYIATITQHPIVRPSPKKILEKIQEKAKETNTSLQSFSIEKYPKSGGVIVEVLGVE